MQQTGVSEGLKRKAGGIFVFSYFPSPYQVELFNAVAAAGTDLMVMYAMQQTDLQVPKEGENLIAQNWSIPTATHVHGFAGSAEMPGRATLRQMGQRDLYVMNYYRHPVAKQLMRARMRSGKPWCFWGERPGARLKGLAGRMVRAVTLAGLRRSRAPIWGIGRWAVEAWEREFGDRRSYHNVPYFSNLERFACSRETPVERPLRVLFSGSLIERKGVDLLASSFAKLAGEFPGVQLTLAGMGPLQPQLEEALSGCRSQVDFRGFVSWNELPSVYAQSDILCVPSRYDGWAMVVPEGLAAGLPVITTDQTGAAHDLITQEKNGWVIPANNEGALWQALRAAAALTPLQRATMSHAAVASVAQHQLADGVARFLKAAEASVPA